jgi:hypothetical protein
MPSRRPTCQGRQPHPASGSTSSTSPPVGGKRAGGIVPLSLSPPDAAAAGFRGGLGRRHAGAARDRGDRPCVCRCSCRSLRRRPPSPYCRWDLSTPGRREHCSRLPASGPRGRRFDSSRPDHHCFNNPSAVLRGLPRPLFPCRGEAGGNGSARRAWRDGGDEDTVESGRAAEAIGRQQIERPPGAGCNARRRLPVGRLRSSLCPAAAV